MMMMMIGYVGQMSMDPGSGVWCSSMKLSVANAIHCIVGLAQGGGMQQICECPILQ